MWLNWNLKILQLILIGVARICGSDSDFSNAGIFRYFNTFRHSMVYSNNSILRQSCHYPESYLSEVRSRSLLLVYVHFRLFHDSFSCGMCLQLEEKVATPTEELRVVTQQAVVVGLCQNCEKGNTLSYQLSRKNTYVTYKAVNCPTEMKRLRMISLRVIKSSSRQLKFQILDAILPTVNIEVILNGYLRCLKHSKDNFFVFEKEEIPSILAVGITSIAGEMLWQTITINQGINSDEIVNLGVQYTEIVTGMSQPAKRCRTENSLANVKVDVPKSLYRQKNIQWTIRQIKGARRIQNILRSDIIIYATLPYKKEVYQQGESAKENTWLQVDIRIRSQAFKGKIFLERCDRKIVTSNRQSEWKNLFRESNCPRQSELSKARKNGIQRIKIEKRLIFKSWKVSDVRCVLVVCPPMSTSAKCNVNCYGLKKRRNFLAVNEIRLRKKRSSNQKNNTYSTDAGLRPTERTRRGSKISSDDAKYLIWFTLGAAAIIIIGILYCLWRKKVAFRSIAAMPQKGRPGIYITKGPSLPPSFTKI